MTKFFPIYQLYLLQLENYELKRFWALLSRKGYFGASAPLRKNIVWTGKAKAIFALSAILYAIFVFFAGLGTSWIVFAITLISFIAPGLYYSISVILLWPCDAFLKKRIMATARRKLEGHENLRIIGIAGSYGKTTMKNVLLHVLGQKYEVTTAPGNINTALGICSWFVKEPIKNADILLIEFGEEYPGDNARTANIFSQDITVVTGISEAHFERLGSIEGVAATIFEAVQNGRQDTVVYLNGDDHNVLKTYKKYLEERKEVFFGRERSNLKISGKKFDSDKLLWSAEVEGIGKIEVPVLAEYIFADIAAAILIAQSLDLSGTEIRQGISKLQPVEHRLQPIKGQGGVLVIDDSYNANPEGVKEAINTLALFKNRRKLYITPGIVETGNKNKEIHETIGEQLASVADIVILVKNSATPHIASGLEKKGFRKKNILWFDSALQAHDSLKDILKPDDVILFQNDWGDQYI